MDGWLEGSSRMWHPQRMYVISPRNKISALSYHINDLHQRQSEAQLQRIRLIHHWPLQNIVRVQQVVQQPLLMVATLGICKTKSVQCNSTYSMVSTGWFTYTWHERPSEGRAKAAGCERSTAIRPLTTTAFFFCGRRPPTARTPCSTTFSRADYCHLMVHFDSLLLLPRLLHSTFYYAFAFN